MSKAPLAAAVLAALAASYSFGAHASTAAPSGQSNSQSTQQATPSSKKAQKVKAIVVTGSLIPQTEIETSTPATTITAADIKAKGFATVAEALQSTAFATGAVQGPQTSGGFTQGAVTMSFFGLPVGFTKYLINGKPMANFPALYNGSDTFNNIDGIPADLVDHIDILPGGQSSLYGSDAIAGVINIVLKDHVSAPTLDARYGWTTKGDGTRRRISFADSWRMGRLNLMAGAQFEDVSPIWGFDRNITSHYFTHGTSPATASRDFLVYEPFTGGYYYEDPNHCANTTSLFHGTEGYRTRANHGNYCGSFYSPGYRTIANGEKTGNFYTHATFDLTPNIEFYGDLLYNYSEKRYAAGSSYTWWGSSVDTKGGAYWDPKLGDFVDIQRAFAPEDFGPGGYNNAMNHNTENSYYLTLGVNGTFGNSNWDYDVGFTHADDHLIQRNWQRWSKAIDSYFQNKVLGPQIGTDPYYNYFPAYEPNYGALYQPISPSDMASFSGYTDTRAKTWNNMLRAQLTNASLFTLPGGDAGLAVVAEGGNEGWDYTPDPRILDGSVWGTTDVQGNGHRSRYALTSELRMPLLKQVTLDVSARHDEYMLHKNNVGKTTYMAGLEYRPFESLLLRARYGTAFKSPTLSDEFQGLSGYYSSVTDYYNCAKLGYTGADVTNCPSQYSDTQYRGTQAGNTSLKPINAKVWSYGVVWAPFERFSITADYFHTSINNEVNQQSADMLAKQEYLCRTGNLDINSPSCQAAISQITRSAAGIITGIYTPKVNVSNETNNAIVVHLSYGHSLGRFGDLSLHASYSDILKHTRQTYPTDPTVNLLRSPYYSDDFKTKANASATWSKDEWSATLYVNRFGATPNYLAQLTNSYATAGAGTVAPWILYNASVRYHPKWDDKLTLSFLVNNLFNALPPKDLSFPGTSSTPYDTNNYNPYGRTMYVEANYKF